MAPIPDARLPAGGAGRFNGEFLLSEIEATLETPDGTERRLEFREAFADFSRMDYPQPVSNADFNIAIAASGSAPHVLRATAS